MNTKLFERYVRDVGRRLPQKQRGDVQDELRSLLMDALQDRLEAREQSVESANEDDVVAVLTTFGPPAEMAAQYRPPKRYVVGPRLFDIYWIVVAAVCGSITLGYVILVVLSGWNIVDSLGGLWSTFAELVDDYFGAMMSSIGSLTLTFAVLERLLPEWATPKDDEAWDPRSLPEVKDDDRIEVPGLIIESVFIVFALLMFNFFSHKIGLGFVASLNDGPNTWHIRPMLAPSFRQIYLPVLTVLWLGNLGLNVVLLRAGRWQRVTRIVDLVLSVGGVLVLAWMVFGPPILTLEAIELPELREVLTTILPITLRFGLFVGLIATIVEIVQKIIRLFRRQEESRVAV